MHPLKARILFFLEKGWGHRCTTVCRAFLATKAEFTGEGDRHLHFADGANVAASLWALTAFHNYPILLGTATLAYTFGLRHAFDADHIAAIDNVTRKLMQEGKRPVAVGFSFSLGHSTIVVALLSESQSPLGPSVEV